jgi:hypothetical protein
MNKLQLFLQYEGGRRIELIEVDADAIGSEIIAAVALDPAVITAGAGNDGTEVNGPVIDRNDFPEARSAKLIISYKAVLAEDKTLSIAANIRHSSASGMSPAGDHGSATGAATDWFAHGQGGFDEAVVATGGSGGTTERGTVEIPVDLRGALRYLQAQVTADLSASGTDTVAISAVLVFGGFRDNPPTSDLVAQPD